MTSSITSIDPNVWYQVTETRVNWTSSFQLIGGLTVMGNICKDAICVWQFNPIPGAANTYAIRNQQSTIKSQLSTCYAASETADTKTVPCLQTSNGDPSQQWVIEPWNDSVNSRKFTNVGNKTLVLDCHPGDPVFMNDQVGSDTLPAPAQHWLFSSISNVNEFVNPQTRLISSR